MKSLQNNNSDKENQFINQVESIRNDSINLEAQKLQEKEDDILSRAKQIEKEMSTLRDQKMELLIKLFKEQLYKDMEQDVEQFNIARLKMLEENKMDLDKQSKLKVEKIDQLHNKIIEQIQTFKMILEDLKDKREELENSRLAAQEYLKIESNKSLQDYKQKCQNQIEIKVKEFKLSLSNRNSINK